MRRGAIVAICALGAAAASLALDPSCVHGPFAGIDPRVYKLWLSRVEEVQPITVIWRLDRSQALTALIVMTMGILGGVWLGLEGLRRPTLRLGLGLSALAMAAVMGCLVWRMMDYVYWIGLPVLAAALSTLLARLGVDLLVPTLAAAVALSPTALSAAVYGSLKILDPKHWHEASPDPDRCFLGHAYNQLALLPPGIVFSEPDLGPFVLSNTPHAVLAAPYHRMSRSLVAVGEAFDSPPAQAEPEVRGLGADYVVYCWTVDVGVRRGSLRALIRQNRAPAWLERLSPPGSTLTIYKVRPPPGALTRSLR